LTVEQPLPAFGAANLSNCEREPIHLAGSVQPYGALVVVRERDHVIVQESENAASFLGFSRRLRGLSLRALGGTLADRLTADMAVGVGSIPVATSCTVGAKNTPCMALVHRTSDGELIVEFERASELADVSIDLERLVPQIVAAASLQSLCDEAARIFGEITGYDRVMIYRFDEEGHGEVFAETRKPDLEAFLGNRYPASDIPQIARRLYERNRVRLLADVNYKPVPLVPRLSPITGKDLDMSLCFLRSVSPIHIQYLQNMGVAATLVVSLMVSGKLWGLISCHHYTQRFLNFELRSVCEFLAEVIGTRIAALESFVRGQGELAARRLEQRMTEWIARDGDWRGALFDRSRPLLLPLGAAGAALLFEGEVLTTGDVPSTEDIREIARWLGPMLKQGLFATANLSVLEPAFGSLAGIASGIMAVTISNQSDEMLIWFRHERVRTVTWGGDPSKAFTDADDPSDLSPRRSFAQWHQIVKGTSDPWTASDVRAARLIRTSISDVVVQFRAVRILIAQDQLDQVSRQVHGSGQQVLVADAHGQVIQSNAAFAEWLGVEPSVLKHIDELPRYFEDPDSVKLRLEALVAENRPWRGEATIVTPHGGAIPVLVRADPVFVTPDRALGFVLLLADLTDSKSAKSARRRFQENILRSQRQFLTVGAGRDDMVVQRLISSVVENAQLAALEITEGTEISEVPGLLEAVGVSVSRTVEVLEQLLRSSAKTD
jgi:light-regulated signal transduction histidine kinase (bacteriophytochrome)